MDIYTVIRVSKKLFDHGYIVIPELKVDFKSALLLLNEQTVDDRFLISKDIVGAEIRGNFALIEKEGKFQLFTKGIDYFCLNVEPEKSSTDPKPEKQVKKSKVVLKNRYLYKSGVKQIGELDTYKKRSVKITNVGKPFVLKQKMHDVPDWLFEKLKDQEVCWIYFEYAEEQLSEAPIETAPINLKSDIESCVKYFKLHGEKTRKKPIINAEAPGNVNLFRYCDLRRIDQELKVLFVCSENYLWLLEQNRQDPLPNIKLNNISFGGWIIPKTTNQDMLNKLIMLDKELKTNPDAYLLSVRE